MEIHSVNGMELLNGNTSRTMNGETSRIMPINGTSRIDATINGDVSRVIPYAESMNGIVLTGDELVDLYSMQPGTYPDDLFNAYPDPQIDGVSDDEYLNYLEEFAAGEPEAVNGLFSFLKRSPEKKARAAERKELRHEKRKARADRQIKGEGGLQRLIGGAASFLGGKGKEAAGAGDYASADAAALMAELGAGAKNLTKDIGEGLGAGAASGAIEEFWNQYKVPIIIVAALIADKVFKLGIVFPKGNKRK